MSQAFANIEIAMLIELRQLLDEKRYSDVIAKTAVVAADGNFSSGNADIVRLLSMRGTALFQLSRHEEALAVVQNALAKIKGTDENLLIAELQSTACRCMVELGRVNEAERAYRDLIATYRRVDNTIGVIRSLNRLSRIHFIKGQYAKSIDHLLEAMDYARAINDSKWKAMITGNLGTILNLSGEFHRALEYLAESLELNLAQGDSVNVSRTLLSQAFAQMHLHNFSEAAAVLNAAEEMIGVDQVANRISLLHYRAQLALLQGEFARSIECATEGLALANSASGLDSDQSQISRVLAEANLGLGNNAEAGQFAGEALAIAERLGERVEVAACRRILAMVAAHNGDTRLTDSEFSAVTRILDDVGARYELARAYQSWSSVATKTSHVREHRTEAERILRSLRVPNESSAVPADSESELASRLMLIGSSSSFTEVMDQVNAIADSEIPVLLLGETGVGKDMIAKHIHQHSSRCNGKFIEVNCSTIPHGLAESELFGHERGAFTSADDTKIGYLEAASGGTLFLNEVGELPLAIQVKLLTALEQKVVCRVGGLVPRKADFRIISATNVDLEEAAKNNSFRKDLFYRLAIMTVKVPRLAERRDDILALFEHFMRLEGVSLRGVDRQTRELLNTKLLNRDWTGNVRELKSEVYLCSVMERRDPRATCLRMISRLTPPAQDITAQVNEGTVPLNEAVEAYERSIIHSALNACDGTIRRAAARLGLPEATLRSKMKKYRISAA